MTEVNRQTLIKRADGFVTANVKDDLMMLNVEQGAYYALDPIAAEIWEMLEHPARVDEIIERLQKRYDVSAEECEKDVMDFVKELNANGMVTLVQDESQ